ncbi:MAG: hypothetical protein M3552_07495 [Planctomycetota bacterium]|nr:hypothetical protein [Planctomycetaceae bacterium]MDQ3330481.1 hypothetical protein [Planctomycetota bacterium]
MPVSTDRPVICLGCGCACDDLSVSVAAGRITGIENACPLGLKWFRDGNFPAAIQCDGVDVSFDRAITTAAEILFANPRRTLIYVSDDVSCAAHGEATALADRIGATIDGPTSDTVADGLLAAQRRGRASATLGELRHRADVVIFWGVDPSARYPRFMERFVTPQPVFATARTLIAVDVDAAHGPRVCGERITLSSRHEVDALSVLRAGLRERGTAPTEGVLAAFVELARRLRSDAKYVAIIFDAEPDDGRRDPDLPEALIAFTQALNASTRAALFALRAGGNRNGFESLLTWQTGFPFAADFAGGHPRYVTDESVAERLSRGRYDAVLVVGSTVNVAVNIAAELKRVPTVIVGPGASEATLAPGVVIDTGAVGIHEGGMVLRMDDVPFEAVPLLSHPTTAADVLRSLSERCAARGSLRS